MTAAYASLVPFVTIMLAISLLIVSQIPKIVRAQRTYKARMAQIDLEFVRGCADDYQRAISEGRISA